ncbi:hypothetical protein QN277_023282 [Acacia crassicarpa]|uniref:Uncharacterized protein n=1 Tax=Acacia crassicarpa TaxID=499986 RepID=A0AAE1MMV0_9FABA|nr:hypothetical protein QN277_023282 [Acacia crassicarpa]
MSESVPGTSGCTSPSGHEDLELSDEGWLAQIFNDAEMEVSSDNINVSGSGDDLIDVAELHDTQPAYEQHVVQQHVSRSHPIIVFKGRKSMDLMPTKLETSVTYPFAFIKPSGAEGDVTLKEINQRIQTPPSSKPKWKKDLVDYVFPDMSESVPGTSGSTSRSGLEDLELSEGWLGQIFNDAEMEVSSDNINVSGSGDDLLDVAELHDTQPAYEQHVVQQHVSRSHPIIVFKGRKSMDLMPTKLETSVTYPFAFIKPSGAEGDVTLKEINQRIQTPPSSKPKGKKDLVDYVFPDMSESVPGTSGGTSPSGHEDLELSEGWPAQIFNDAEMEVSSDNMYDSLDNDFRHNVAIYNDPMIVLFDSAMFQGLVMI